MECFNGKAATLLVNDVNFSTQIVWQLSKFFAFALNTTILQRIIVNCELYSQYVRKLSDIVIASGLKSIYEPFKPDVSAFTRWWCFILLSHQRLVMLCYCCWFRCCCCYCYNNSVIVVVVFMVFGVRNNHLLRLFVQNNGLKIVGIVGLYFAVHFLCFSAFRSASSFCHKLLL